MNHLVTRETRIAFPTRDGGHTRVATVGDATTFGAVEFSATITRHSYAGLYVVATRTHGLPLTSETFATLAAAREHVRQTFAAIA